MKTRSLLAGLALIAATLLPEIASAATTAYTTGNVNMRAGPSTRYPRITTVPHGATVTVYGCTQGYSWCDSSYRGLRGWISGSYLAFGYQGRHVLVPSYGYSVGIPIIGFSIGSYWPRYYGRYDWYDSWDRDGRPSRWYNPPSRRAPPRVVHPQPPRSGQMPGRIVRPGGGPSGWGSSGNSPYWKPDNQR
ncbi:SH3 domain-containing protein [Propylenella binzhouense]|uniref:Peptide-binding protein n=1 Tax=Propylenella binzhouense TaxID=2555902 RepID=A0A964WVN5_9HYPH|nr:SH3 domain-containing protein [Propylenella binzhouense]MYZ50238.1 peptide-binding protein [Propylenella binzhouense]